MKKKLTFYAELVATILDATGSYIIVFEGTSSKLITSTGKELLDLETLSDVAKHLIKKENAAFGLLDFKEFQKKQNNKIQNSSETQTISYSVLLDKKNTIIGYVLATFNDSFKISANQKKSILLLSKNISRKLKTNKTEKENQQDLPLVEKQNLKHIDQKILNNSFKFSEDVFCTIDINNNFEMVSIASLKVWGYTPKEMIGTNYFNYILEEDIQKTKEAAELLLSSNHLNLFENRYKHKNGSVVDVLWSVHFNKDEKRMYCIAKDVTVYNQLIKKSKENENSLEESNKKYKYLFENNPLPLFVFDFNTLDIVDCNAESLLFYGYTKEEFLSMSILDLRPKEDIDLLIEATKNETKYGNIHKKTWRHLKKNGDLVYVEVTGHLLEYNNKKCSLVLINDITSEIEYKKRQIEHAQFIETTLENLPIGIAVNKINEGTATLMNIKFSEIYGWPKETLTDVSTFFEKVYPDATYREQIRQQVVSDMSSKDPDKMNWEGITIYTQSGEKRIINAKNIPIYDQNLMISTVVDVTEKFNIQKSLQESNERYYYVTKATSDAIWDWDLVKNVFYRAEGFKTIFGFDLEILNSQQVKWEEFIHPEDRVSSTQSILRAIDSADNYWKHDYRIKKPNGEIAFVKDSAYLIRDENNKVIRIIGALKDITKSNYYHNVEILEREILEMNALGTVPIDEIITKYMLGIEKLHSDMLCSMQVRKGKQLFNLASPSLPEDYLEAISGIIIGANVGSCGTAAFTRKKVIVTDIPNDFRWANYKEVAAKHGLKACWSHPILNSEGKVLATFATYYREVKSPTTVEENTIERASHILQVILESYIKEKALKDSNLRYEYVTKATSDAIWDWDFENNIVYRAEGFKTIFGFDLEILNSQKVNWEEFIHPEDRSSSTQSILRAIDSADNYWKHEYRIKKPNGEIAFVLDCAYLIRDENNKVTRAIGAMQDITKQKKEEQQLKLYESVVTNTSDSILITEAEPFDAPGPRILYVNEAFSKMTGYTKEEVIGKNPRILQGPKTDKEELKKIAKAIRAWQPCESTIINYDKKGNEFWINFSMAPVANKNGWYTHWIAIERDVTAQKIEEQKRVLLNEISLIFNTDVSLKDASSGMLKYISKTFDFPLLELWLLDETEQELNLYTKYISPYTTINNTQFYQKSKKKYKRKKGEGLTGTVWQSGTVEIWTTNDKKSNFLREYEANQAGIHKIISIPILYNKVVLGVLVIAETEDITRYNDKILYSNEVGLYIGSEIKRKQLEQELSKIFNFSPDIICIINIKGFFKRINPAACKLLEYSENELLNMSIFNLLHPDDLRTTFKKITTLQTEFKTHYFENRFITKSGNIIWLAWTSSFSKDGYAYSVGKDITERIVSENQLKILNQNLVQQSKELSLSNKELEQFAYVASHDLQEPLRMVTSFLTLLEKRYYDVLDEKGLKYINFAVDGAKNMRQIILDILDFSRINDSEANYEYIDLNDILNEVILVQSKLIKDKNAEINVNQLPKIYSIRHFLLQLFQNLISNALKYSKENVVPVITINSKEFKSYYQITIEDNGIGIDEEYYDKIFIIFQRLHGKDEYAGNGVGLAIVKKIVEKLKGEIWIKSQVGKGSTFYLNIPKNKI